MNSYEFCRSAYLSAAKYYRHIELMQKANSKDPSKGVAGCSNHKITSITPFKNTSTDFLCDVEGKIFDVDSCEVLFRGDSKHSIEIVKYSIRRRQAVLRFPLYLVLSCGAFSPEDLLIVSDLKFLIKRLGIFYRDKYESVSFSPPAPDPLPPHGYPRQITLTDEQQRAVDGVFSNPVSYVWGPPGTGKTRAVLSECVLRYISVKKRILLLAPTNNSVEQMLRGILPTLKNAGIDLGCVYRVGTASTEFAKEYPEVVGDSFLEKELEDLEQQKQDLLSELSNSLAYEEELLVNRSRVDSIRCLRSDLLQYYELSSRSELIRRKLRSSNTRLYRIRASISSLHNEFSPTIEKSEKYSSELRDCFQSLRSMLRFSPSRYSVILRITELFTAKSSLQSDLDRFQSSLSSFQKDAEKLTSAILKYSAQEETVIHDMDGLRSHLLSSADLPGEIEALFLDLPSISKADALSRFDSALSSLDPVPVEPVFFRPSCEIKRDLEAVEASIADLSKNQKVSQRKRAIVIAATVDTILKSFPPEQDIPYYHVFLDEAGYTSLIRGCVPFCCNCPVTFLGDHFQLAPICEMDRRNKLKGEPAISEGDKEVSLFSVPCAYFSELISLSMDEFYNLYFSTNEGKNPAEVPPCFDPSVFPMFPLTVSYRFHDSLAQLLSEHIYHTPFHGASSDPFEIVLLDSPNPHKPWNIFSSESDARAICLFLQSAPSHYLDDVAIFSPYNAQVNLLRSSVSLSRDNIITVNRSQGMEYETVILSVVDTFKTKFLTGTNTARGRRLLNTAISRAKKRIVICCDISQWSTRSGQLLSALISLGTLWSPSSPSPAQIPASAPEPPAASAPAAAGSPV